MRLRFFPWREGDNLPSIHVQPHQNRDFSRRQTERSAPLCRAISVCMVHLLGNPIRSMMSHDSTSPRVGVYRHLRMHSHSPCWPVCTPQWFLTIRRWTHNHSDTDQAMCASTATPGALMHTGHHQACNRACDMVHPRPAKDCGLPHMRAIGRCSSGRGGRVSSVR
jgi:hypothetical protein